MNKCYLYFSYLLIALFVLANISVVAQNLNRVSYESFCKEGDSIISVANKILYTKPDSVISLMNMLVGNCTENTYKGRILNTLGAAFLVKGNLDSSQYYYSTDTSARNSLDLANAYSGLGGVFAGQQLNQQALIFYLKGARLYDSLNNETFLAGAYNNIANILTRTEDYAQAKSYYLRAIEIHEHQSDSMRLLPNIYNLGDLFRLLMAYDSARYYGEQLLTISKKLKSQYGQAKAYGLLASIDNETENFSKALANAEQGEQLMLALGDNSSFIEMSIKKAYALLGLGKQQASEQIALDLLTDTAQSSANHKPELFDLLLQNAKVRGDYETALYYQELQNEEENKIFNAKKNATIRELQAKYESDKKQKLIGELEQKAALTEAQNQRRNTIFIAVLIVMVLSSIIVFVSYQRKIEQQKSVALIANLKFLQSQMNPHFMYNSLTSVQRYVIENRSEEATTYISKFSRLMRQFLEHSRLEYIAIHEEVNAIENYLELQKLRYKHKFDYTVEVKGDRFSNCLIPPMFVQPFVENAIEHGFRELKTEGFLKIVYLFEDSKCFVKVSDNGSGFAASNTSQKENHRSLASIIVKERMEALTKIYKQKIEYHYNTTTNGTEVQLVLPIKLSNESSHS